MFSKSNNWHILAMIVLSAALMIGLYKSYKHFYPDIPGFCYSQKRFLSDEEFIQIALHKSLTDDLTLQSVDIIDESIESISKFKQEHPHCCRRVNAGEQPQGAASSDIWHFEVGLRFKKQEQSSLSKSNEYVTFTVMDKCGEVLFPD